MADKSRIKVSLVRSLHGRFKGHKECVRGLGLRRIGEIVEIEDTPSARGMIKKVSYMVKVIEDAKDAS